MFHVFLKNKKNKSLNLNDCRQLCLRPFHYLIKKQRLNNLSYSCSTYNSLILKKAIKKSFSSILDGRLKKPKALFCPEREGNRSLFSTSSFNPMLSMNIYKLKKKMIISCALKKVYGINNTRLSNISELNMEQYILTSNFFFETCLHTIELEKTLIRKAFQIHFAQQLPGNCSIGTSHLVVQKRSNGLLFNSENTSTYQQNLPLHYYFIKRANNYNNSIDDIFPFEESYNRLFASANAPSSEKKKPELSCFIKKKLPAFFLRTKVHSRTKSRLYPLSSEGGVIHTLSKKKDSAFGNVIRKDFESELIRRFPKETVCSRFDEFVEDGRCIFLQKEGTIKQKGLSLWSLEETNPRSFSFSPLKKSNYFGQQKEKTKTPKITRTSYSYAVENKTEGAIEKKRERQKQKGIFSRFLLKDQQDTLHAYFHTDEKESNPMPFMCASWVFEHFTEQLAYSRKNSLRSVLNQLINRFKVLIKPTQKSCEQAQELQTGFKNKKATNPRFIGLRITLTGRLSSKKKAMAQKITKSIGKVPLNTLKQKIDYDQGFIATRVGLVGVKVWVCYC